MPLLHLHGRTYDIDLIAFDKDGTLLDFDHIWGNLFDDWLGKLATAAGASAELRQRLNETVGYNPATRGVVADSPLAVATLSKIQVACMTVLYQHGRTWHEAEQLVAAVAAQAETTITADLVRPLGDVAGTFARLRAQGFRLALITSDDRALTEATLPLLGIEQLVEILVCGDDPIPNKPAPDGLWHIGRVLGVAPSRMAIVGDTASDMVCGHAAGAGLCVGIAGGAGDALKLAQTADVVLGSVAELGEGL